MAGELPGVREPASHSVLRDQEYWIPPGCRRAPDGRAEPEWRRLDSRLGSGQRARPGPHQGGGSFRGRSPRRSPSRFASSPSVGRFTRPARRPTRMGTGTSASSSTFPGARTCRPRPRTGRSGCIRWKASIDVRAVNGPISLRELAGDVRARAQNGPISITLGGSRWKGAGLDAETHNGPMVLYVPEGYNAHLETGTTNGPMSIGFPITVVGRSLQQRITTTLGDGGPTIRARTQNGPLDHQETVRGAQGRSGSLRVAQAPSLFVGPECMLRTHEAYSCAHPSALSTLSAL